MSRRPLRIAMIGQQGIPARHGGVERVAEELGARLVERGHQVTAFNSRKEPTDHARTHRGIALEYLPSTTGKYTGNLSLSLAGTARTLTCGFDIAHYHAIGPSILTPLCRLRPKLGVVSTVHGRDDQRDKWGGAASKMLAVAARVTAREPDEVIVVSEALKRDFAECFGRETIHIPNGVVRPADRPTIDLDVHDLYGIPRVPYFLALGRLVPEKAVGEAIEALRTVPGDAALVIVGGSSNAGPYEAGLRQLATDNERVIITGPVFGERLDAIFRQAAAFVAPSHLEGLPLTVLEAASYGLPVICSDIPPHREIVGADDDGRHLHPVGDVGALATCMRMVLDRSAEEASGAKALRDDVLARYDWDDVAARTEDVYYRIVDAK